MTEADLLTGAIGLVAAVLVLVGVLANAAHWHDERRRSHWR
jgi:hypothetical protein